MTERTIKLPVSKETVKSLKLGEVVYLDGEFYCARDEAHHRALEELGHGKKLPVDFSGRAVFHCGPIVRKTGTAWEALAAGPTTSARMNAYEPEFIEKTGVSAVIGKGGMNKDTLAAMQKHGCVYLAITGGAAILAAKGMKIKRVEWLDLGTPEALWVMDGMHFGPLIVAMDAHGGSLYADLEKEVAKNAEAIRKKLGIA
jgi:tartrate/fumarate subfamily iron-sulfur-dependent hydro-lyase beta chain